MTQSLEDLAKEINARLIKSDQYDCKADDQVRDLRQKAEDFRISAGKLMIEARKRVDAGEAGDIKWEKWCSQNVNRSQGDIRKIMRIAGHLEPEKALADERAAARAGMAEHRANTRDVSAVSPENTVELPSDDEAACGDDGKVRAQPAVKVDDGLMKWIAAFRSWPRPRQEMALSLIGVDEDSLADLKEVNDLLELRGELIDAQREKIGQLEQESRSLQERLASQLDSKPEPDQDREPDMVDEPKPAAPEVTLPEPGMSEPELSEIDRAVLQMFQDRAASNSSPWIGIVGREDLSIDEDAVDRLAAAGLLVQSPANPHSYAVAP